MSRVYLPLSEWYPSAIVEGGPCTAEREYSFDSVPLGEVGGCLVSAASCPQSADMYTRAGGATYPPFSPDGSIAQAKMKQRRSGKLPADDDALTATRLFSTVLRLATRTAATVAPWLRGIVPVCAQDLRWNATKLDSRRLSISSRSESMTSIVHLAFHPHLPLIAVALRDCEQHYRVLLYDVCQSQLLPVTLTHAFQDAYGIHSLSWKPFSRDVLFVGCGGGVLAWSLTMRQATQMPSSSSSAMPQQASLFGITDTTPACVFYSCSGGGTPVTTISWSRRRAEYVACASEHSPFLCVHDITRPPTDSLRCSLMTLEGGISAAQFAQDDSFIVRAVHKRRVVKVTALPSMQEHSIATQTPVDDMVLLGARDDMNNNQNQSSAAASSSPSTFALQLHNTEGVAIVRIQLVDGRNSNSSKDEPHTRQRAVLMYLSLISTGLHHGIGGSVVVMSASTMRLYLQVSSGHMIVIALPPATTSGEYTSLLRCIGVVPAVPSSSDPCCLATFPNFHRGSLCAWSHNGAVHFLPSYHL